MEDGDEKPVCVPEDGDFCPRGLCVHGWIGIHESEGVVGIEIIGYGG